MFRKGDLVRVKQHVRDKLALSKALRNLIADGIGTVVETLPDDVVEVGWTPSKALHLARGMQAFACTAWHQADDLEIADGTN